MVFVMFVGWKLQKHLEKLRAEAEIITDITSTGSTLKANNLRVLKDGNILESQAYVLISKKSKKKTTRSDLSKLFM